MTYCKTRTSYVVIVRVLSLSSCDMPRSYIKTSEELHPVLQPIHHLRQLLVDRGQQVLVNIPVV